jgi:hypothetical protein
VRDPAIDDDQRKQIREMMSDLQNSFDEPKTDDDEPKTDDEDHS